MSTMSYVLLLGLTSLLAGSSARAETSDPRVVTLIARAQHARLAEDPVWLALLQIDPGIASLRHSSSATAERFFLAEGGHRNARKELAATLEAFFDQSARVADAEEPQHPQCAFIARRDYLERMLGLRHAGMEWLACRYYDEWREGLSATGLTLIYPEGFMNNPASMFGHTLLRIDVATEIEADEILGYAVDFTGEAGGDSGLPFIAKGIVGAYQGRFGVHPYYEQLRRYAEWENRDIWEYKLDLDPEELDFMLMHLWELRGIEHPYFFFTENCSYHLYRLLELAKARLRERDAMATFVIPIDTVRAAIETEGIVGDIRYRASPATKLEAELRDMPRRERELSREVAEGNIPATSDEVAALPVAARARVLDIAYERLRYSFVTGTREEKESQHLARQILIARSRVKGVPPRSKTDVRVPAVRPDRGHASSAASLSGGYRDDEAYIDFQVRPAFHTLMDREGGYPRHMQIRFLDLNLRYFPERGRVRLEEVTIIEALSLSPRGEVFRPVAWHFSMGLATRRVKEDGGLEDAAIGRFEIGMGLAADPLEGLHLYGLGAATLDAGPGLEDDASFGPGARLGAYFTWPGDRVKSHLYGDYRSYLLGDVTHRVRAGTQQRLVLSRNTALIAEGSWNRTEGEEYLQAELSFQLHF
ncbi:MAG: DUF4105 domain-containing protein [bacterium]|nr:DUF4105 domain-containing protein [bacterium]